MSDTEQYRVLVLEDSPEDAELIQRRLRKISLNLSLRHVVTKAEYMDSLEKFDPDIIISDYKLPELDGLSALALARKRNPSIPFIIVSGFVDDRFASETLKAGATDYILKDRPERLGPAVERALREIVQLDSMRRSVKDREELKLQAKMLREIDKAKEEFSAMISHELKTPLVPIQGYCEMLLGGMYGELTPKQKEKIEVMRRNSLSLLHLIQDILDVHKLEIGKMGFDTHDVSAKELIDTCVNAFLPAAESKNVHLIREVEPELRLKCDPERIQQVLKNLVGNALKFVPEQTGRIEVSARRDNGSILFSVKDNGIGIPKEKQRDLFKKFYQVDTSLRRKSSGTGLGLAICNGIVEAHNGKIWVESEEGKGSTFYVRIPNRGEEQ